MYNLDYIHATAPPCAPQIHPHDICVKTKYKFSLIIFGLEKSADALMKYVCTMYT